MTRRLRLTNRRLQALWAACSYVSASYDVAEGDGDISPSRAAETLDALKWVEQELDRQSPALAAVAPSRAA